MSGPRKSESELKVGYNAETDQLNFSYSKRGLDHAVGLRIVPEVVLGISPRGRILTWAIDNPRLNLAPYLENPEDFTLKEGLHWKRALDQQVVEPLLARSDDTEAFLSRWIIRDSSKPYVRR